MNGAGLSTVGRLLQRRRPETTAIYADLHDAALRGAAEKAATVIARAMGQRIVRLGTIGRTEGWTGLAARS